MITRRKFVVQGASSLAFLAVAFSAAGCKRKLTRADVLATIARDVALPSMRALAQVDAALVRAVAALPSAPRVQDLATARAALAQALLAWERAYVFRSGPLVETNAFLRAKFWPVRKSSFHQLLHGETAIDASRVAALGVDVKGLFALERLFWEKVARADGESPLFEIRPERAQSLANALARDVQLHAARAQKLLGDGNAFVTNFAQGGQASVALLVTQLVETVEAIVTDRFERVLGLHRNARLKPGELLGDFAGLSTQLTVATLRQVEALYVGAHDDGLSALVQQAAPKIDAHLRRLLIEAVHASEAIGGPLEQVVKRDPGQIERARERAKALELAFKVELTSALAVTLSIAAGDGD